MFKSLYFSFLLMLILNVRALVFRSDNKFVSKDIAFSDSVLIICDMWDNHWCKKMLHEINELSYKINSFLPYARSLGITVIHSPAKVVRFYSIYSQRKKILMLRGLINLPTLRNQTLRFGSLPTHLPNSGCGCKPKCTEPLITIKQNNNINIDERDLISDSYEEIYTYMKTNNKKNVFYTGVHLDCCLMYREFGIIQMSSLFDCFIIRDLVDSCYYNSDGFPYVSHERGLDILCRYIEKHYCYSLISNDLTYMAMN